MQLLSNIKAHVAIEQGASCSIHCLSDSLCPNIFSNEGMIVRINEPLSVCLHQSRIET